MTSTEEPRSPWRAGSRWLLLGSLALNLFFIGVAVAISVRAPPHKSRWHRDVFVRVERIAETLPVADAAIVREAMQKNHDAIAAAQKGYRDAREAIRETLRQEPFKAEDMRAAMAKTRDARQTYDQTVYGVFADIVPRLSSPARHGLADWRSRRRAKRDR